jgi:multicomponent Na+:H+ antiporter subunit D
LFAVAVIVISTVLNAAYFMPIVYAAFFKAEDSVQDHDQHGEGHADHGEAPWPILLALVTTALFAVLLFFFPGVPLALVQRMVAL